MSDHRRVGRNALEPDPGAGLTTSALWSAYLDWQRADVVDGVLSLPPREQRTSRVRSGWTPLELLSHVVHMEQRWFVWGFLGEPVADPWGDWTARPGTPGARWAVPPEVGAEEVAVRCEEVAARTRAVLADHELSDLARVGGRFAEDPPTLEWICFHVLAEYARHAGHLDLAVELSADGPR